MKRFFALLPAALCAAALCLPAYADIAVDPSPSPVSAEPSHWGVWAAVAAAVLLCAVLLAARKRKGKKREENSQSR